jgi:hypothetical protein
MNNIDTSSLVAKVKKYRLLIFAAGLLLLSISQQKFIMPFVYDVIKSGLFLVDSKDNGSNYPISTPLSNIAFTHCNNHIKSTVAPDTVVTFAEHPLRAWSLGNYQFMISSEIKIGQENKKYVCRITYNKGDNEEDALNIKNWTIVGVSDL